MQSARDYPIKPKPKMNDITNTLRLKKPKVFTKFESLKEFKAKRLSIQQNHLEISQTIDQQDAILGSQNTKENEFGYYSTSVLNFCLFKGSSTPSGKRNIKFQIE